MKKYIKEFFYSDECEYNQANTPSKEKNRAVRDRNALLQKLKSHLSPEDMKLFEEYDNYCSTVRDEDEYYAFICGARMTLDVLAEIFCTGKC